MQELIDQIVEKTGVTARQAKDSADMAVDWVKGKLPEGIRETVGGFLEGAGGMAADVVAKGKDVTEAAAGAAGDAASTAGGAVEGAWDKAKDAATNLMPGESE